MIPHGRLLTAPPDGPLYHANGRYEEILAFFEDGTLLVVDGRVQAPEVDSFQAWVTRFGYAVKTIEAVAYEVIKEAYDKARQGSMRGHDMMGGQMSREILAMFGESVHFKGALSDIHIDVLRSTEIIYRIDGTLYRRATEGQPFGEQLVHALFQMGSLDAGDAQRNRRAYQAARISRTTRPDLPGDLDAIRLQFSPTANDGQSLSGRLLYYMEDDACGDLGPLGFTDAEQERFKRLRSYSDGVVLIGGGTGTGKSTTLQRNMISKLAESEVDAGAELKIPGSMVQLVPLRDVRLVTVEDPPELRIPGGIQLPVANVVSAEERSTAFVEALNAALRMDPETLMPSEIRDEASAELMIKAARSGHSVWSSIHTQSAMGTISRLRGQKVDPYDLTDHTLFRGLIHQRLVRRLCPHCSISAAEAAQANVVPSDFWKSLQSCLEIDQIARCRFARPGGCPLCRGGYKGRLAVVEMIEPDEEWMKFVAAGNAGGAMHDWLTRMGGRTIFENAVDKMLTGATSPLQVAKWVAPFVPKGYRRLDQSHTHLRVVAG